MMLVLVPAVFFGQPETPKVYQFGVHQFGVMNEMRLKEVIPEGALMNEMMLEALYYQIQEEEQY